jgi:hypothetical protein
MPPHTYALCKSRLRSVAAHKAIIAKQSARSLIPLRLQPTALVVSDGKDGEETHLFFRVSIESKGRAGLPQRAYLRAIASQSQPSNCGELQIKPGWPRSLIEIFLDALWYGMISFPAITFLLRYLEQRTPEHTLALALFLILIIADRVCVGWLYRSGKQTLPRIIDQGDDEDENSSFQREPEDVQDWLSRFDN